MPAPHNPFKAAIAAGELQLGCWLGLADPYIVEISAGAGFDWLLIDGEHAPNDLRSITAQLQVIAGRGSHAMVRPPIGETWIIKQLLDAGAQSLLIPMVESGAQAAELVDAVTYPPHGVRGVGSALARASDFAAIGDYLTTARDQICLLAQVENQKGMDALDNILAVDGLDGVFIGPSDLAADMGYHRQTRSGRGQGRCAGRHQADRRGGQGGGHPDAGSGLAGAMPCLRRDFHRDRNRCDAVRPQYADIRGGRSASGSSNQATYRGKGGADAPLS